MQAKLLGTEPHFLLQLTHSQTMGRAEDKYTTKIPTMYSHQEEEPKPWLQHFHTTESILKMGLNVFFIIFGL